jgi:hypothetical protein
MYEPDGDLLVATTLTQGPWGPNAQYGGAPSAVLTWAVEQVPTLVPMRAARLTFDLHRSVPLGPLRVGASVAREGKRLQLVTATISTPDGVEVARCTALRLRVGAGPEEGMSDPHHPAVVPPPGPGELRTSDNADRVGFLKGMEIREGSGRYAATWYRVVAPVVLGHPLTPATRLAMVADFTANSANHLDQRRWSAINPEVSLHVLREPVGEWHAVVTRSWYERDGIGLSRADLFDEVGLVGTCATTMLVDEAPAPFA